jgi:hypothetical protein
MGLKEQVRCLYSQLLISNNRQHRRQPQLSPRLGPQRTRPTPRPSPRLGPQRYQRLQLTPPLMKIHQVSGTGCHYYIWQLLII